MTSDATKEILDALADLQLKVGVGGVRRDHILVTLLPPPADSRRREQLKRQLDDLVPERIMRYGPVGALPPTYELTHQGWLQTKHASRVLQIIKAFLDAFRAHATTGSTTQRLEWPDLVAQGLTDSDYHFACIVARCFDLQNGGSVQTWNGKNAPRAEFGLPIDFDELLDVINPDDLVAKRRGISYVRLHARKVITGEITGHISRAVEHIYKSFVRTGSWPLSRTLRVELAKEGIDLEEIASGRFAQGYDVYTEGARTTLTLAGLLIPAEAEDDRRLVVQVLRFIGDYARTHPEDRIVDALTVMKRVDIDEPEITAVSKMLLSAGSTYVTTASNTFDITKMNFYPSPNFIAHADAKDLWDIVLNEEEERLRWQVRSLEGVPPEAAAAADESVDPDEDLDHSVTPRDVKVPAPQVREGTEFPATIMFVLIKGLKDCSDAPQVPNALQALNDALRGVDASTHVLSTIAGVIVVIPDNASWSVDQTFKALDQAQVGFALRVGVTHGTVEVLTDVDGQQNMIGPPINIAARLASSPDNPSTLIHESYATSVNSTLSATHWLHRTNRKPRVITGKPQDPPFTCFAGPQLFEARPTPPPPEPRWRKAVLVAYDLPKFSAGDRAQLRKRFTRLAQVFQRLHQSSSTMATATALLSPGGDGGVLVLEGPSLADAAALSLRLRELTKIESRDHAESIGVEIRIGVHYGHITHYMNARDVERPTGLDVFIADELAGDLHARTRNGIILTRPLADALASGSQAEIDASFEPLPPLTSGPAADVDRFVHRSAGSSP